ncbi:MAG: hypothetical protein LBL38_02770 [Lactobacillales bacterium]|jgi:hypothetical protein|nr:hypothetical protein [Lactobacillales bacterium]
MKKEMFKKIISLFLFVAAYTVLNCAQTSAAVLKQTNDEPITAPGQLVFFVGTNGFRGTNTPISHQNDQTDTWMVMQVAGDYALIVKQNPIAVQTYGNLGAVYTQSNIKNSVETWFDNLPPIQINGVDFHEYVLRVRLDGANQSSPFGYNLADQMNYRTVVDPNGARVAFVPSLIDVNGKANGALDAGKSNWQSFASTDLATAGSVGQTWLRSPLNSPFSTAAIGNDGGISYNNKTNISKLTLRPACWVRVKEVAPPRLMQKDDQPVTACGQIVEFVGTSEFNGVNTPFEHQADLFDDYMVMQIEEGPDGKQALVMKKNPIAVQKFKDGGTEARYDQSDIKVSVENWYRRLPHTLINGVDFHEYILPVILNGESQSMPNGYNLADQSCYKTVVDMQRGVKMAFVPSVIDVDREVNNTLDAGRDKWKEFVSELPILSNQYSRYTWLRCPLIISAVAYPCAAHIIAFDRNYDGAIGFNAIDGGDVYNNEQSLRSAFWVNI